jgi:hypothetical protein
MREKHRTTADLIAELRVEAERDGVMDAGLIVAFENHNDRVMANGPDPLGRLNDLIRSGGEPLGLWTFNDQGDGTASLRIRALAEYEGEEWVERFLATVAGEIKREIHFGRYPGLSLGGGDE